MSDTPRCDELVENSYKVGREDWEAFARQLERELAAMTKERDAYRTDVLDKCEIVKAYQYSVRQMREELDKLGERAEAAEKVCACSEGIWSAIQKGQLSRAAGLIENEQNFNLEEWRATREDDE